MKNQLTLLAASLLLLQNAYAENNTMLSAASQFNPSISLILDGNYYKYTYINSIISEETIVDVIPRNSTIDIVISAGILPEVITFNGGFYLYAQYLPYEDFDVIINIFS
jgi:hypothetical protein